MKIGLVLEGGGMRGQYTAGVLDYFIEKQLDVDYVIGVSAGACNGISYVSKQKERNHTVNTRFAGDKRYISLHSFLKTRSFIGMDFMFDEVPNQLEVFDYKAFNDSRCEFVVGATDVHTGLPVYFTKADMDKKCTILRASCSIPVYTPVVEFRGNQYLDGGVSAPVPFEQSFTDGCQKVIVILTRTRNYHKMPEKFRFIYRKALKSYPHMIEALDKRHQVYNQALRSIHELEAEGKALIIAPEWPLNISRLESNADKLTQVYHLGKDDAKRQFQQIINFVQP